MMISLLLILQTASAPLPRPLDSAQMEAIGCIATLGLVAYDQRRGDGAAQRFPDITERGKIYAGLLGDRIVFDSGQPKEVIALAIRQSVAGQQEKAINAGSDAQRIAFIDGLMAKCLPLLDAEVPKKQDPELQAPEPQEAEAKP